MEIYGFFTFVSSIVFYFFGAHCLEFLRIQFDANKLALGIK